MSQPQLQIVPPAAPREYTLQILQFPKKPAVVGSKPGKPRQSSAAITWLYRRFVEGHLPRYPTSEQFIATTIPFLLRAMSPEAVAIMSAVFARRHANIWHGERTQHLNACRVQINNIMPLVTSELSEATLERLQSIQRRCRKNATTAALICSDLADERGEFFLDCRSLQRRLLLSTPMTALRILRRLVKSGILLPTQSGNTPWDAKQADQKKIANTYTLISK